jgi:hypothetical protein
MRSLKLLFALSTLLTLSAPASAAIIQSLGPNPTSASGTFENAVGGTTFDDQYTFTLTGVTNFTIAGVQNVYAQPSDFISNFDANIYNYGPNGIFEGTLAGNGDDVLVINGGPPVACSGNPNCQVIAGSATLIGGNYYAEVTGTGSGTSGYTGGVATVAEPVPEASTWLMILLGFLSIGLTAYRRAKPPLLT